MAENRTSWKGWPPSSSQGGFSSDTRPLVQRVNRWIELKLTACGHWQPAGVPRRNHPISASE